MNSFINGKLVDAAAGEFLPVRIVDPFALHHCPTTRPWSRRCGPRAARPSCTRARPVPGRRRPAVPFEAGFYRRFDDAPRRLGGVGAALKAAEHVRDGLALAGAAPPGAITHFQWLPFPLADARIVRRVRRRGPVVVTVHDTRPFNGSPTSRRPALGLRRRPRRRRPADRPHRGRARPPRRARAPRRSGCASSRTGRSASPARSAAGPTPGASPSSPSARCAPTRASTSSPAPSAASMPAIVPGLRVIVAGEPMMDLAELRDIVADAGLGGTVEIVPRRLGEAEMERLLRARRRLRLPLPRDRGERGLLPRPGPRALGDRLAASAPSPRRSRTASPAASCRRTTSRPSPRRSSSASS